MRIGIDVRYLSHGLVGGVHTYIAHLVPALLELTHAHEVVLYADTKRPFELTNLPAHVQVRLLPYRNGLSSIYHDLTLQRIMATDRLDVVHFPANYGIGPRGARTIITLHDAINILPLREIIRGHAKSPRTIAMMTYLHTCSTYAIRRADRILTVSHHAAREIARAGNLPIDRIVPVPHAPTPDLRRITDAQVIRDVHTRHGITGGFVLADALKNPAALVRAWRRLPADIRRGRTIVFFSRRPDPLPIVFDAVCTGDALLLVRPSREDLIALYSSADAFVFPSWIEGFGIPVLEAMTCGAPVIASDRGSIPEVAGGAALLADAEDDGRFAEHLHTIYTVPEQATRLRQAGFARARQFSWTMTAERVLACYESALQPATNRVISTNF